MTPSSPQSIPPPVLTCGQVASCLVRVPHCGGTVSAGQPRVAWGIHAWSLVASSPTPLTTDGLCNSQEDATPLWCCCTWG